MLQYTVCVITVKLQTFNDNLLVSKNLWFFCLTPDYRFGVAYSTSMELLVVIPLRRVFATDQCTRVWFPFVWPLSYPSICPMIHPSIHSSVHPSTHPSIHGSVCYSICCAICFPIHLSSVSVSHQRTWVTPRYLFIHLSGHNHLPIHLSMYPSIPSK